MLHMHELLILYDVGTFSLRLRLSTVESLLLTINVLKKQSLTEGLKSAYDLFSSE
jgi:hypothetical protein